jgi:Calcineurin-like phosphoesterase
MMATTNALLSRFLVACWLILSTGGSPAFIAAGPAPDSAATKGKLTLPRTEGSVRFGVMGDTGRGEREQMEVAAQMAAFHEQFPYPLVIMLGDNIYGTDTPADMKAKFDTPYKPLLDAGVEFRASLGNHDNPNQRFYKPFNMDGQRYYTFRPKQGPDKDLGSVRFFVLDSNYLDKEQLDWLDKQLSESTSQWKIAYFHHPLYSSGGAHGSSLESRAVLEPLFVKYGVSAVFAGHDHFYERTKPQKGDIVHWVSGAGGSLRKGDLRPGPLTAKGFDSDMSFMLAEIVGDDLYFQAISRTGATVDSGVVHRPGAPPAAPAASPSPVPVQVPSVAPGGRTTPEGPASPKPVVASPPPSASPATTPAARAKASPSASPSPSPRP